MTVVLKAQTMCESRGGRPGLPVPKSPYGLCGCKVKLTEDEKEEAGLFRAAIGT